MKSIRRFKGVLGFCFSVAESVLVSCVAGGKSTPSIEDEVSVTVSSSAARRRAFAASAAAATSTTSTAARCAAATADCPARLALSTLSSAKTRMETRSCVTAACANARARVACVFCVGASESTSVQAPNDRACLPAAGAAARAATSHSAASASAPRTAASRARAQSRSREDASARATAYPCVVFSFPSPPLVPSPRTKASSSTNAERAAGRGARAGKTRVSNTST